MKRFLSLMIFLLVIAATSFAQNREITGKVIESDTKSAVSQTTVQLLKSDSSFVGGTVTSNNGSFKVEQSQPTWQRCRCRKTPLSTTLTPTAFPKARCSRSW